MCTFFTKSFNFSLSSRFHNKSFKKQKSCPAGFFQMDIKHLQLLAGCCKQFSPNFILFFTCSAQAAPDFLSNRYNIKMLKRNVCFSHAFFTSSFCHNLMLDRLKNSLCEIVHIYNHGRTALFYPSYNQHFKLPSSSLVFYKTSTCYFMLHFQKQNFLQKARFPLATLAVSG